jgi:pyridoxine 5-phosphate synthase
MIKLSVNLNRIALLRNSRGIGLPSVTRYAQLAIDAGAQGITVHPRPDQRHITVLDVEQLQALLAPQTDIEFNMEGNPFSHGPAAFLPLVERIKPHQCTLVPDADHQLTSDHGWDLKVQAAIVTPVVQRLKALGCRVSLFMDADVDQIHRAHAVGADRVELYTKPWADAYGQANASQVLQTYVEAMRAARLLKMQVNIGHDLNLQNLPTFVAHMNDVAEASIGHALTCDALEHGYVNTIKAYQASLNEAPFTQFLQKY